MPAVLTHKTIMLLARERVVDMQKVLQARIDSGAANVTTLERQLLAAATECARVFASEPRPNTQLPGVAFAPPVGKDNTTYPISQFAVMGSMGPDIPAFSGLLAPGQAWLFDTIHKGTPDPNRELVNAQTSDLIMEFWAQARDKIIAEVGPGKQRDQALDRMCAYVMGHLCHTAADVISHPYVNDFQWQLAPHDVDKFHHQAEGVMDALVATKVLRRSSTRGGQDWDNWWPRAEDVPEHFFRAYRDALEQVYKATGRSRKGYQEFEQALTALGPPDLDVDFIRDGYHMYRHGVVSIGYGFGYWSYWGLLAFLMVPAIAVPYALAGLPNARALFLSDRPNTERAFMEFLTVPMVFGLVPALAFGTLVGTRSTRGVAGRFWLGMAGLILCVALAVVFFVTLGADKLPAGFSWSTLFGIPAGLGLLQLLLASVAGIRGERKGRMALGLIFALPLLLTILVFLLFGLLGGLAVETPGDSAFGALPFWGVTIVWTFTLVVLWFTEPSRLRDLKIPEKTTDTRIGKRFVRLFDDTTLHEDTELAGRNIPSRVYPSNRRRLLKLWWQGAGEKHLRSDRFQLVFADDDQGSNPVVVPAPIVPMSLDEYRLFIEAQVVGVKGELLFPDDPGYMLPAGATFSDHADGADSLLNHANEAAKFRQLGSSPGNTDYELFHAPKQVLSVLYGARGPVPPQRNIGDPPLAQDPAETGYDYLHDPAASAASDALMSIAGDFGAVLCLAATTHMTSLKDSASQDVGKVYQVFRNWSLDRRRLNEWRAIVSGGAENDKGANRQGYDANMLRHQGVANPASFRSALLGTAATPSAAAQAAFAQGESSARQLGWVPLLREWLDVARTPGQDPLAAAAMRPGNPDNLALSRAMAWLFDQADPQASP